MCWLAREQGSKHPLGECCQLPRERRDGHWHSWHCWTQAADALRHCKTNPWACESITGIPFDLCATSKSCSEPEVLGTSLPLQPIS